MEENFKIGQEVFIHGYVDEIRKDVIIIRNEGGYFGTVKEEILTDKQGGYVPVQAVERNKIDEIIEKVKDESYLSYDDNPRHILDEECVLAIIKEVLESKE